VNETILEVVALARSEVQSNGVSLRRGSRRTCPLFWAIEFNYSKCSSI